MESEVDWNATARVLRLTTYYRDDDYVTEYGLRLVVMTETFNSTAILQLNSESHAMISISRGQP